MIKIIKEKYKSFFKLAGSKIKKERDSILSNFNITEEMMDNFIKKTIEFFTNY